MGLDNCRVYHGLELLADLYGGAGEEPVVLLLTQEHLRRGLRRGSWSDRLTVLLQRLVAQGVVELGRGRFTVLDRPALRRKAGPS